MKSVATRLVGLSVLAAIAIGVTPWPASADVVRWHLPGMIDGSFECFASDCSFIESQNELLLQFFPVGTPVQFDLTIDTQDRCSSPDAGLYNVTEIAVTINNVTRRGEGFLGRNLLAFVGCPAVDPVLGMYVAAAIDGFNAGPLSVFFVEMFFGQIPGDELPTVPPSGWFYLEPEFWQRSLEGLSFPGTVVPEPSTLALALSGLVAAAARGRRGRPRTRKIDLLPDDPGRLF